MGAANGSDKVHEFHEGKQRKTGEKGQKGEKGDFKTWRSLRFPMMEVIINTTWGFP